MKVLVVLQAVLGTALAAILHGSVDKTPNGLAALLAEKGGVLVGASGTRIVGGELKNIEEVPYIASLQRLNRHRCGCVIIRWDKILTAAHCMNLWTGTKFVAIPSSDLRVRAGSSNSRNGGQLVQVERYVNHPQFDDDTFDNDITVIHLSSPLSSATGVSTIDLPIHNAAVPIGTSARVSGWGVIEPESGPESAFLRAVNVPYINNDDCDRQYDGGITPGMLCAGFPEGGRDACQGDSGGPLSAHNQVIGIVSWGEGCADPDYPGVYARVAYFVPWINAN